MNVAIIKYNAGNIHSVDCALRRVGVEPVITDDPQLLLRADKVVFPGVGEARSTMDYLREHRLDELIKRLTQPVLGICIGMQLLCRSSEEGDVDCLGIFDVPVRRFVSPSPDLRVPHMGWNNIRNLRGKLFDGVGEEEWVYYVHSYYAPVCDATAAVTDYVAPFSAALSKDNFFATQFHAEKSGATGERILRNFLEL
jgi:glutamine amidotransferase